MKWLPEIIGIACETLSIKQFLNNLLYTENLKQRFRLPFINILRIRGYDFFRDYVHPDSSIIRYSGITLQQAAAICLAVHGAQHNSL